MRRTTPLTVAALAALASAVVLLGSTAATGAGETCRGEPATIVGEAGEPVTGTPGRDVVVTNGSPAVDTLGGDDVICVTEGGERGWWVQLDAGPGADAVDSTAADLSSVQGELGPGSDRFEGGAGGDTVLGGSYVLPEGHVDDAADVLIGGAGRDDLASGQRGLPNADVVDGGVDGDTLTYLGPQVLEGMLVGGDGSDAVDSVAVDLGAGQNVLDNAAGRLTTAGAVRLSWSGLEQFFVHDPPADTADLEFLGSGADETLAYSAAGVVVADAAGGDDEIRLGRVPPAGSRLAGGTGRDRLTIRSSEQALTWDLRGAGILLDDGDLLPASGFEDADLTAPGVHLTGTDGPNLLVADACDTALRGRDGDDTLSLFWDDRPVHVFCGKRKTMMGGSGDDRLLSRARLRDLMLGGPGRDFLESAGGRDVLRGGRGRDRGEAGAQDDVFRGGPGRDMVDGDEGTDLCVAERRTRCER